LVVDAMNHDIGQRIAQGLARIGIAQRQQAWAAGGERNLTPTQAQMLSQLGAVGPLRLKELAAQLAITPATASDAVRVLVEKKLVSKKAATDDRRAVELGLTAAGRREAKRVAQWPDFLVQAIDVLSMEERAAFLRGLVKMIATLQERGEIPVARMCTSCKFFRPHVYRDLKKPHHCDFVDAPFGDAGLQTDCPDHDAAPEVRQRELLQVFVNGQPATS